MIRAEATDHFTGSTNKVNCKQLQLHRKRFCVGQRALSSLHTHGAQEERREVVANGAIVYAGRAGLWAARAHVVEAGDRGGSGLRCALRRRAACWHRCAIVAWRPGSLGAVLYADVSA